MKEIWRLLEPDEIIRVGDEFWCKSEKKWNDSVSVGVCKGDFAFPYRRRMTIPEDGGWIAYADRMPTQEDADKFGEVIALNCQNGTFARRWEWSVPSTMFNTVTHWRRSNLPIPIDPDQKLRQEAEEMLKGREVSEDFRQGYTEMYIELKKGQS